MTKKIVPLPKEYMSGWLKFNRLALPFTAFLLAILLISPAVGEENKKNSTEIYARLIMMAIRPNWHTLAMPGDDLTVQISVHVSPDGRILNATISHSSGRADFDAAALNALNKTGILPPPPTPELQSIVINFTSQMAVR